MKDIIKYVAVFAAYQIAGSIVTKTFLTLTNASFSQATELTICSALASLLTIATFVACKWCGTSMDYLRQARWKECLITAVMACGCIIPLALLQELIPDDLRGDILADVFAQLLHDPIGYIMIGLLAPITEEVVFRGTILRSLLISAQNSQGKSGASAMRAIFISAILFAIIHMNPAQIPFAFIGGLILGWLYVRTGSIVPGIIYHLVNNSTAYLTAALNPDIPYDAPMSAYFHNDTTILTVATITSIIIATLSAITFHRTTAK